MKKYHREEIDYFLQEIQDIFSIFLSWYKLVIISIWSVDYLLTTDAILFNDTISRIKKDQNSTKQTAILTTTPQVQPKEDIWMKVYGEFMTIHDTYTRVLHRSIGKHWISKKIYESRSLDIFSCWQSEKDFPYYVNLL